MERKLASIQTIKDINPIQGADMIEVATVNAWKLVVKKGDFHVGEKVIYCEIDSFLPIKEQFEFLRKSSYKKMGDLEGFRLRTIKLRGQVSQGLLMPLSVLFETVPTYLAGSFKIGTDVSEYLGIIKYEPPIPAELAGKVKGNFPSFLQKTDEERIQNLSDIYDDLRKEKYYVTEKLDGSSATYYFNNGVFGVCSRNLELLESDGNSFWKAARNLDLEAKLISYGKNISLQGELIGEGIQGNPYKIKGQYVSFFRGFNIDEQRYLKLSELLKTILELGVSTVPFVEFEYSLPETIPELLLFAEGKSVICSTTEREGLVFCNDTRTISFKAISNKYLLNEK